VKHVEGGIRVSKIRAAWVCEENKMLYVAELRRSQLRHRRRLDSSQAGAWVISDATVPAGEKGQCVDKHWKLQVVVDCVCEARGRGGALATPTAVAALRTALLVVPPGSQAGKHVSQGACDASMDFQTFLSNKVFAALPFIAAAVASGQHLEEVKFLNSTIARLKDKVAAAEKEAAVAHTIKVGLQLQSKSPGMLQWPLPQHSVTVCMRS
jgi:hypothetical protein